MWKEPAIPRHVVQIIPIDVQGNILVMHRSDKVKSAKNVWSFPTGTHEIGETVVQTVKREMEEEYCLQTNRGIVYLGNYENIIDGYHWVLTVVAAIYDDLRQAVNNEPDMHDEMKIMRITEVAFTDFWNNHPFHSSFHDWVYLNRFNFCEVLLRCSNQ